MSEIVDLRKYLDAEYNKGVEDGRSAAYIEMENLNQQEVQATLKSEREEFRLRVEQAFLPLADVLRIYLVGDSDW